MVGQSNPTIYKGNDAKVWLVGTAGGAAPGGTWTAHGTFALSDFTLTLSKGTVEQELIGEIGNYQIAGALTAEGSMTGCKMYSTGLGVLLGCLIGGTNLGVSGNCGANSLHFYLRSCQVTGFDFTLGSAEDITEGSVDFAVLYPYKISSVTTGSYSLITDNIWP